jgi:hypothetical protein
MTRPLANGGATKPRNVLIVTYPFLPLYDVGAKRVVKICRHLPEFGWNPIILTKDWDKDERPEDAYFPRFREPERINEIGYPLRVVHAPYETRHNALIAIHEWLKAHAITGGRFGRLLSALPRNILSAFYPMFGQFPDKYVGWVKPAVKSGLAAIREHNVDAIVSVCPPQTAHIVGSQLARESGLPWIPLFDDLYGFYIGINDWYGAARPRMTATVFNKRTLKPATYAAAITPALLRYVEQRYGLEGDTVAVGFDPDEDVSAPPAKRPGMFSLVYTGSVYPGDQRPEIFFDGLDLLLAREPELARRLDVRFYGIRAEDAMREELAGRPCESLCSIHPRVLTGEVRALQRSADALLVFNYTNPAAADGTLSFPAKTFEYLGAGRPILAVPRDIGGYGDTLLESTGGGIPVDDAEQAANVLGAWLREWAKTGRLAFHGNAEEIGRYTTRSQTGRLAALLDRALGVGEAARGDRKAEPSELTAAVG